MKQTRLRVMATLLFAILISACSTVALSGRKRVDLVPDETVLAMSYQQYAAFMKEAPVSTNQAQTARVRQIGERIAKATELYLQASGMGKDIKNFQWEFNLVASDQVNAFCMPGGKIVVYEGILPVARNDDQLATVIAHEVAHAVAKHSNEQMSQQILKQYGASALASMVSGSSGLAQVATSVAYELGNQVFFSLPYSRKHEYEADQIGLYLMALAGYDYREAPQLWYNMSGGRASKDFLSTHPSDNKRIEAIEKEIPKVDAFIQEVRTGKPVKPSTLPTPDATKKIKGNEKRATPIITHY